MRLNIVICIACGEPRSYLFVACKECGFQPETRDERAKTYILSECYIVNEFLRAKTRTELEAAGEEIRRGSYSFDPIEVEEVATFLDWQRSEVSPRRIGRQVVSGVVAVVPYFLLALGVMIALSVVLQPIVSSLVASAVFFLLLLRKGRREPSAASIRGCALSWLQDRRVFTCTAATAPYEDGRGLSAEIVELYSMYDTATMRYGGVHFSREDVQEHPLVPGSFRIGIVDKCDLIVSKDGRLAEFDNTTATSRPAGTLFSWLVSTCELMFPHLAGDHPRHPPNDKRS